MAQASSVTNCFTQLQPGHLRLISDVAADDSDKTLTVPATAFWEILWISASLASTATAGNRNMRVAVANPAGTVIDTIDADSVQTASGTEYYHWGYFGAAVETPATHHYIPLPTTILPASYTIRIYDSAAVAAAADDLTVNMLVVEYPGG